MAFKTSCTMSNIKERKRKRKKEKEKENSQNVLKNVSVVFVTKPSRE